MLATRFVACLAFLICWICVSDGFVVAPSSSLQTCRGLPSSVPINPLVLHAAGGKRKKRRRREAKKSPEREPKGPSPVESVETVTEPEIKTETKDVGGGEPIPNEDLMQMKDVASFEFKPDKAIIKGVRDDEDAPEASSEAIPLPDIKETLKKKEMEEELARMEEEQEAKKVKIKRSDKKALTKLLEQQPYADADESFFEEEEYGTVSALLGERAKPFLGIPTGPLQVGHFMLALGIILMAFIEYPGFPLTNLPTPLRDCLQGGLATVYSINVILAGFAFFKAAERGQPALLWVAKTISVGGLAYDQLTQLPTLEQVEAAKAKKGKRALKRN